MGNEKGDDRERAHFYFLGFFHLFASSSICLCFIGLGFITLHTENQILSRVIKKDEILNGEVGHVTAIEKF